MRSNPRLDQEPSRSQLAVRCVLNRVSAFMTRIGIRDILTSVNKHKFWWAVLLVIRSLFDANLRQVPDVDPPVTGRGGKDSGIVGRPRKM